MASYDTDLRSKIFFQTVQTCIVALVLLVSSAPVLGVIHPTGKSDPGEQNLQARCDDPADLESALAGNSLPTAPPDYLAFVESVRNGQAGLLRGVYVPGLFALPIVQQPAGDPGFVSQNRDELTQFGMAAEAGNVGLLAHNYLSGKLFPQLAPGQEVRLVFGDGAGEAFIVERILRYQALDPGDPSGQFRDLETGAILSAGELFQKVYRGERHVTFQTCIDAHHNKSWGRLFILAQPKPLSFWE